MEETKNYKVNFFKPINGQTKANMKMVSIMIIIWVLAVFGFQVLLILLGEPTAEKAYSSYEKVWAKLSSGQEISVEEKQDLTRALLSVIGKNIIINKDYKKPDGSKENHKKILSETFTWSVFNLLPNDQKDNFMQKLDVIATNLSKKDELQKKLDADTTSTTKISEKDKAELTKSIKDLEDSIKKGDTELTPMCISVIGLQNKGFDKLMSEFIPFSLVSIDGPKLSDTNKEAIPRIMKLYLFHNQSALTDTTFLGFPFHYWYTAQFLLILFILLCFVYAIITDRIDKKYNVPEN